MNRRSPQERDLILVQIGSTQEQNLKWRPAICLRKLPPTYNELLVCGLSSNTSLYVEGFDEIVTPNDDRLGNLQCPSVIRLGFLTRIRIGTVRGVIGTISVTRHRRLLKKLSDYLIQRIP